MGSDAPDFEPLLRQAIEHQTVSVVLADAGYDSQHNHRLARDDLGICSLIKAMVGRHSDQPATDDSRRLMQETLQGSQAGKPYGQRSQVETVMSMIKRNLGDSLKAKLRERREMEMLLKVLTHNAMIVWCPSRGSQQSPPDPFSSPFSSPLFFPRISSSTKVMVYLIPGKKRGVETGREEAGPLKTISDTVSDAHDCNHDIYQHRRSYHGTKRGPYGQVIWALATVGIFPLKGIFQ